MADIQYSGGYTPESDFDYAQAQAQTAADVSRATQLINWAGAIVSIGLVVGMAIWAWQLLMRDVTDVPVIRAMEGPMRVAPENPGGAVAENQGLAVNRLAEGAEAAPVPDELVLAPPPIDLDDVPELEQAFQSASEAATVASTDPVEEALAVEAEVVEEAPVVAEAEDTEALIERLLAEAQPLEPVEEAAPADDASLVARADTIPISVPGVRRSPRPASRPAGLQARAEAAAAAAAAAPATTEAAVAETVVAADEFEIAASELETGTRLVQLGAFDTPELARAEWQRLAQTYPDFFLGRARVIEQASSGGQSFYRLRAHGFGDLSASRRFCAALVAQGAACIPVTVR